MLSDDRPMYRSVMYVAIQNEKVEFLLQRRANTGFLDGYYDLASGHLEHGESCEDCAIREAEEECGVTIHPDDLELVATFQSTFEPSVKYLNMIYHVKKFSGEPTIGEPNKIDEIGWYKPENFPEKITVGTHVFLMALQEDTVKNYYIDVDGYKSMTCEDYIS